MTTIKLRISSILEGYYKMNSNQTKEINSFKKTWDILSPAVYFYAVYNIALILLVFITNTIMNNIDSANTQILIEHNKTVNGMINGLAGLLGILPLFQMLKSQLYRNKILINSEKAKGLQYLITCVIAFASSIGLNILFILTGLIEHSESYQQVAERQYGVAFGIGLFLYGIISPFTEEVVFRGLLYNRMKKYYPTILSVIVSAVLFGAVHGNMIQALYGTCMGLLLAYTYEKFKDFTIPCIFHAIANITVYTITNNSQLYTAIVRPYNCVILLGIAICTIIYLEKEYIVKLISSSNRIDNK